jgi:predicted NBD/HSP70 family sugar kinase
VHSQKGVNQDKIQAMNRSLLINLIREEGICSRVQLAHLSGLQQATVTNIINDLISWGFVKEVGFLVGNKGRRSIGIALNTNMYFVIGIRLSRKYFEVVIFDLSGKIRVEKKVDIVKGQIPKDTITDIKQTIRGLMKKYSELPIVAIGMAIPGPFIKQKSRIVLMTESSAWSQISLKEELEEVFHLPVFLEHDANAGVFAQLWHDPVTIKRKCLIYLAAGQGIGAGIMYNNKILKGELGLAGEIGHTSIYFDGPECECGNKGCLERYCSSIILTKLINQKKSTRILNLADIKSSIEKGDEECIEIYKIVCSYLAIGIINLINSFNPSIIIIGDELAQIAPEIMENQVKSLVKSRILPDVYENVQIKISSMEKDPALLGAGIVAIHHIFSDLTRFYPQNNSTA